MLTPYLNGNNSCQFLPYISSCVQGEREFRLDPMLEDHEALMQRMNTWNFQIFDLVDRTGGKSGRILSYVSTICTSQSSPVALAVCLII